MVRRRLSYVWAWPNHLLLQEGLNFAVLIKGLNGYTLCWSIHTTTPKYRLYILDTVNPDRLALTKPEIVMFCDRVINKWSQDTTKNAKNILAMNAIKTSVLWTDDETLKAVWGEITEWMFELLYENAKAQAMQEGATWADTLKDVKS